MASRVIAAQVEVACRADEFSSAFEAEVDAADVVSDAGALVVSVVDRFSFKQN